MPDLERVSLAIEKDLIERFDRLLERRDKKNRSEAIRDLVRNRIIEEEWETGRGETVATVTLVYDHTKRELADRLLEAGHEHHGMVLATMHVHLDETNCLEVIALRGRPTELRHLADHLIGMKGVKHGKLVMSSAAV
jgi:CopG family nickel-responsive transcriptional regulator